MPSSGVFLLHFCCCALKVLPHRKPCALLCSALHKGAKSQCSQKRERKAYIISNLCKARLKHDIESDSPLPDLLSFQTSRPHDIKSTSNLIKCDIISRSQKRMHFALNLSLPGQTFTLFAYPFPSDIDLFPQRGSP